MIRLLYVVSHPIQYQAPLLRLIAGQPDIRLKVLFKRIVTEGAFDPGFGRQVRWDVPLLDGYDYDRLGWRSFGRELAQADVLWLHGWEGAAMKAMLVAARLAGVPVLMRGENWDGAMPEFPGWRGRVRRLALSTLLSLCRAVLTIGSRNALYYRRHKVAEDRLFLMPYAIDNQAFGAAALVSDPEALRQRLGLPQGRRIILFAGKLMRRKHPHTLLAAWRQAFADESGRPLLVFVGEGEMAGELAAASGPDVHFLGFRNQSEMPGLYALADIFVLAAEREAWGLAINEAMACGTAVIASDQCAAAFDLIDENVGRVVAPGDVRALAAALTEILPRAQIMGERAKAKVAAWDFAADVAGLRQALKFVLRPRP